MDDVALATMLRSATEPASPELAGRIAAALRVELGERTGATTGNSGSPSALDRPEPRHPRGRRRHLAVAAGLLVAVGAVITVAAYAGRDPDEPLDEPLPPPTTTIAETIPTTTSIVVATTTSQLPPTPPLSALTEHRLDFDRLGPVIIGMTLDEARLATGLPFHEDLADSLGECSNARPLDGDGVGLLLRYGRIVAIEALPPITTVVGVGPGSSEDDVLTAFRSAQTGSVFDPNAGTTRRFITATSPDPHLEGFRMRFWIGDSSTVEHVEVFPADDTPALYGCA